MALDEFKTLDTEPLIASEPAHPRDSSRLLVLERATGAIHHKIFREIGEFLKAGDLIVINDSKVFPARLLGNKPSGGKSEILLVRQDAEPSLWYGLARDCRCGNTVLFEGGLKAEAISRNEQGELLFRFSGGDALSYAMEHGKIPLPHYITKTRKRMHEAEQQNSDFENYQTVFAQNTGSIAAPTAGLHFTPRLMTELKEHGVSFAEVTLHVGWGTFRPVKVDNPADHTMLPEYATVKPEVAAVINKARAEGRRIVSVGTTSTRTLETFTTPEGVTQSGSRWANTYIYPPYRFKGINALITNFHLHDSTPLLLASAFAGQDKLFAAYKEAVALKYRFYSYGDAMLIV